MERPRKAPAIYKKIREISAEEIRVRVLGRVKRSEEGFVIIADDSGEIKVNTKEKFKEGSLVRVFGRPLKAGNAVELEAEIIQSMNSLNEKLYKRIELLLR